MKLSTVITLVLWLLICLWLGRKYGVEPPPPPQIAIMIVTEWVDDPLYHSFGYDQYRWRLGQWVCPRSSDTIVWMVNSGGVCLEK
jgi:hypothetical protein